MQVTVTSPHGQSTYDSVEEAFHRMALEYKTSDYLHDCQTIIVIQPHTGQDKIDRAKKRLTNAMTELEYLQGEL